MKQSSKTDKIEPRAEDNRQETAISRPVTIADVARASACSITTVSHVINEVSSARVSADTRKRVRDSIQKLGYRPNRMGRALANRRTMMIGLVADYEAGDFPLETARMEIISGIQSVLNNSDFDLVLIHPQKAASWARSRGVDGAIVVSPLKLDDVKIFTDSGITVVAMEPATRLPVSTVGADEFYAVRQALEHLIELGHQRIAFIGPVKHPSCMGLRTEAYRQIMREHNLPPMDDLLFSEDSSNLMPLLDSVPEIVKARRITGILAMTDGLAVRAMNRMRKEGMVAPQDISIIGIDGTLMSNVSIPPLSTVRNPLHERGRRAAEMLLKQIQNPHLPIEHIVFAVSLIRRESTGTPPREP
jgi:LacI family transcriptional regulator